MYDPNADTVAPYELPAYSDLPVRDTQRRRSPRRPGNQERAPQSLAPLDRRTLDRSRPWFLVLLGAVGLAVSWGTTVLLGLQAEQVLLQESSWRGVLAGLFLAAFLTAGQLYFSDVSLLVYLLFLAPDVAISYLLLHDPVLLLMEAAFGTAAPVQWLTAGAILILVTISSYLPERTLFGARRK